ncbi:MAG: DUF1840 domain-containing protein [Povalibacter sp.]|jgi:hypothetical protein
MLVTFRSSATDSVHMFGEVATQLIRMMGGTGRVPGAFNAEDVPSALRQLESSLELLKNQPHAQSSATAAPPADNEDSSADDEEEDAEPPVELAVRAIPLVGLLKRAAAAKAEVMWEGK